MLKSITAAALLIATVAGIAPLEAKVCRNSHGRRFPCHHVLAPRVNTHDRHPVKVVRCRGHIGKFNNCTK